MIVNGAVVLKHILCAECSETVSLKLVCTALLTRSSCYPQHRHFHSELFPLYFICILWRQDYCSEHVHVDVMKRVKRCAVVTFAYIWVSFILNTTHCVQTEISCHCISLNIARIKRSKN
jgi:hypothetical protein